MAELIGQMIAGITYGLILLLISLGLTVVFGIGRVVNFAHGAFYALGAFVGVSLAPYLGLFGAMIVAPLVVAALAIFLDHLVIHKVRHHSELMTFILTYGLLLILTNLTREVWGTNSQYIDIPQSLQGFWEILGVRIGRYQLAAGGIALAVAVGLLTILYRTEIGLKFRASSEDPDVAAFIGIDVERMFRVVFATGSGLAAFAGVVSVPLYSAVVGMEEIVIYTFVIVIVGGLGSLRGTVLAALLVGVLTSVGSAYVAAWSNMLVFLLMLVVLILEPRGIFREGRVLI
ncbi:branched-chain amino acid ABC transporter permease [Limibacillus sp. MBR-115]|jgi:branched-subunit amino acid ABC-type transport system permease component|uniref:branched-chain amino acid ABC transporter permease n=1 Tax=Limibacillus sp. MBR-115 TaxID=3156465 RepID=UPI00339B2EC6